MLPASTVPQPILCGSRIHIAYRCLASAGGHARRLCRPHDCALAVPFLMNHIPMGLVAKLTELWIDLLLAVALVRPWSPIGLARVRTFFARDAGTRSLVWAGAAVGLVYFAATISFDVLAGIGSAKFGLAPLEHLIRGSSLAALSATLGLQVLLGPFIEELYVRGNLLDWLNSRLNRTAAVVSAQSFSASCTSMSATGVWMPALQFRCRLDSV